MRVRAATPDECQGIGRQIHYAPSADVRGIVAEDRYGLVAGGVLYDSWTENAVHAHVWLDSPIAAKSLLRPAFSYPFEEAGLGLLLGVIPWPRWRARRLVQRLGFVELYRVADGWSKGEPLVVYGMRREACPHLQRRAA